MKVIQIDDLKIVRRLTRPVGQTNVILDAYFNVKVLAQRAAEWWYITVPEGFSSDLGSVPAVGRLFVTKLDGMEAAIVHDWLYYSGKSTRVVADKVFYTMLKSQLPGWKAYAMYKAVRAFGSISWSTHRARDSQE